MGKMPSPVFIKTKNVRKFLSNFSNLILRDYCKNIWLNNFFSSYLSIRLCINCFIRIFNLLWTPSTSFCFTLSYERPPVVQENMEIICFVLEIDPSCINVRAFTFVIRILTESTHINTWWVNFKHKTYDFHTFLDDWAVIYLIKKTLIED